MKQVVVLGAGYAGVLTAKKLAKKCRSREDIHITLIDKNPFHTMLTELHEVAAGRVDESSIRMDLQKIFAGRKVEVVLDTIVSNDISAKTLQGANGRVYPYDYLVLCAGSQPTYFGVQGAQEYSQPFWSYQDAIDLRERVQAMFRKASLLQDPVERRKLLSFYVVGAGFTGVELIGELAEYVPYLCEQYGIDRQEVLLCCADILPRTVPILPQKLSEKVEARLVKQGVVMRLGQGVVGIGPDFIRLKQSNEEVLEYPAGTVVWTAGIESADITQQAAAQLPSEKRGRIQVEPTLCSPADASVYIVGDNMYYMAQGEETPVPQMVENCEQASDIAAHNLHQVLTGGSALKPYRPAFHGVMVSVGSRYAVARVGTPKHMFNLPSFLAMLSKHFINIVYFFQVLGWNKVFSYVRQEFFTIRRRRSILGGHFSNVTPSFLMVPLRVWLGFTWLFEGLKKVQEGWFENPMLTNFFGGANQFYNQILFPGLVSTGQTADAVSAATGAVSGTAQAAAGAPLFNLNLFGLIRFIFVSSKPLEQAGISDYAFRVDLPALNWFINSWVLPHDAMQMFMQVSIVIVEVLIGLALMAGLLTSLSALVSLVLQMMFVTTTGIYSGTFWMVFAGLAMLIGAGQTFGLDYYVMPKIKAWWKRIPWVRKSYLYHD